ncbi:diguanylate cyclase [Magnetovibrio sp. PR-2]|uniref:diguanylate cyclase domain-containing protein n=1 Tax=Magnetovibrio sp. PR-2 TaxID=3120356 RepID=UPI002FCDFA24
MDTLQTTSPSSTDGEHSERSVDTPVLDRLSAETLGTLFDELSDLVVVCIDGEIRHVNKMGAALLDAGSADALLGKRFQDFICDDFADSIQDIISVMAGETDATPLRVQTLKGKMISLNIKVQFLSDLGTCAHVVLGENLTAQTMMAEAMHKSEQRFRKLVNNALDLICVVDGGKVNYINKAGLSLLKLNNKNDIIGKSLDDFLHENYQGLLDGDVTEFADEEMLMPMRFMDQQGNILDAEVSLTMLDRATGSNYMIEARDITAHNRAVTALRASIENLEQRVRERTQELQDEVMERRRAEEKLRHVATHDGLTDLPNRSLLMDRLKTSIARANRSKEKCAVVFIDLDGFKPINDTLGHDKGDLVLQETAKRLNACVRQTDTAARFGGDEFVLVLSDISHADDAIPVAEKILEILAEPIVCGDAEARIGASIGIAMYPDHGEDAEAVIKCADNAMYDIKASGKNNFGFAPLP